MPTDGFFSHVLYHPLGHWIYLALLRVLVGFLALLAAKHSLQRGRSPLTYVTLSVFGVFQLWAALTTQAANAPIFNLFTFASNSCLLVFLYQISRSRKKGK